MSRDVFNLTVRLSLLILRRFCPPQHCEEIEGDLIQKYLVDIKNFGLSAARLRLIWNVIRFFRLGILLRNRFKVLPARNLMLFNHSKIVFRQASKHKMISLINVMGLTIAVTIGLFISQFVWFESSFEAHIKHADRTYRVNLYNTQNGVFDKISAGTVSGLAYQIKQSLPAIELVGRIGDKRAGVVSNDERGIIDNEEIIFADRSIVDLLAIDFLHGAQRSAVGNPESVIISASVASKYFGSTDVAGKSLQIGFNGNTVEKKSYAIKAVFDDIPVNSHQRFQIVLPPENEQRWDENWDWSNVTTYLQLKANVQPGALSAGLAQIVREHHTDSLSDRYILEPITSIRLHALDGSGRASVTNFFMLLGIVILVLAWSNYINLSTSRFLDRMKEVGIRKLIGASRGHLLFQFLIESLAFNVVAALFGLILFRICWPTVALITDLPSTVTLLSQPFVFVMLLSFVFLSTLATGLYPAWHFSNFVPLQSLKGKVTTSVDRAALRKTLVVGQFAIAIILLTSVLAIERQIVFMQTHDIGISIDQTMIIEEPLLTEASSVDRFETIRNEILQMPGVIGVTYASSYPGAEIDWHRTDIKLGNENEDFRYSSRIIAIGTEFLEVFALPLVSGRNFSSQIQSDDKAMLLNEEACKMFGFVPTDALDKVIFVGSRRFEVIGVVKNYHYRSLQGNLQPLLYIQGYPRNPKFAVKLSGENIPEAVSMIESKWKLTYAGNAFNYYFLDEYFDRQYASENKFGAIVSGLTCIAIFISCSGLLGLSLYSVETKAKEISIRKVFGATISNVVVLFTRGLFWQLLCGGLIAIPLSFLIIKIWLEDYAYKMPIEGWMLILPFAVVCLIALTTVGFQTVAAAKKNPVEHMKCE